jgi:hypothetical protein
MVMLFALQILDINPFDSGLENRGYKNSSLVCHWHGDDLLLTICEAIATHNTSVTPKLCPLSNNRKQMSLKKLALPSCVHTSAIYLFMATPIYQAIIMSNGMH